MWLQEEDKNTRFFHKMTDAHRRRNHLSRIKINGEWFSEDAEMKTHVVRAYQGLLSATGKGQPCSNKLSFESLELSEVAALELPFSDEEVFFFFFFLS